MTNQAPKTLALVAVTMRLVLGINFLIAGTTNLIRLVDATSQVAFTTHLASHSGIISDFFGQIVFNTLQVPHWHFFAVSAAIVACVGFCLMIGLLTRTMTVLIALGIIIEITVLPGLSPAQAPAIFLLSLQVGTLGMLAAQYCLGAGPMAIDNKLFGRQLPDVNWNVIGLCLRWGVAYPLLIGGLFSLFTTEIPTFDSYPVITLIVGMFIAIGPKVICRIGGACVALLAIWYLSGIMDPAQSFWANLNMLRFPLIYFFAGLVLSHMGGGKKGVLFS